MKKQLIFLTALFMTALFPSCTKEPAELGIKVSVEKTSYIAGEEVLFIISGQADFVTFYDGLPGNEYINYPGAGNETLPYTGKPMTFSKTYNNFNGQITATFIASSYGNWGEDEKVKRFDFTIDIKDNRTGIVSCILKTSGLSGKEYNGVVNDDNHQITVSIPTGTTITKLTTSLIAESPLSKVYRNDVIFKNKSSVDFSAGPVVFKVVAADGTAQDWTVTVNFV